MGLSGWFHSNVLDGSLEGLFFTKRGKDDDVGAANPYCMGTIVVGSPLFIIFLFHLARPILRGIGKHDYAITLLYVFLAVLF